MHLKRAPGQAPGQRTSTFCSWVSPAVVKERCHAQKQACRRCGIDPQSLRPCNARISRRNGVTGAEKLNRPPAHGVFVTQAQLLLEGASTALNRAPREQSWLRQEQLPSCGYRNWLIPRCLVPIVPARRWNKNHSFGLCMPLGVTSTFRFRNPK